MRQRREKRNRRIEIILTPRLDEIAEMLNEINCFNLKGSAIRLNLLYNETKVSKKSVNALLCANKRYIVDYAFDF
jgi:hypothetical protein